MTEIIKKVLPSPGEYVFNFRSRKMWIAIILFAFSTFLFATPLVPVAFLEWSGFIKWVFGIYIITNAVSKGVVEGISNWKSRKLYGLLVILATTTVFLFTGAVVFAEWAGMTQWAYGIYAGASVGGKYIERLNL